MIAGTMHEGVFDCAAWKAMLDREGLGAADASIGVLMKDDFTARSGKLLVWCGTPVGVSVSVRAYCGEFDADVAMLIVADCDALQSLLARGLAHLPQLVRQGRLHLYILWTQKGLDDAGLADLVEEFGLVFPRH